MWNAVHSPERGHVPRNVVGWLMVFPQWAAIRDAFLPLQQSLKLCPVCHRRCEGDGGGLRSPRGPVSHGHFVHISSAPGSRSPSFPGLRSLTRNV